MNPDNYLGEITNEPGTSVLSKERWIQVIDEHVNLEPIKPREIINPFTKKNFVVYPRRDVAHVVVEGETVGSMSWAEDDSILINVYGDQQAVVPIAHEIAKVLGARFNAGTAE